MFISQTNSTNDWLKQHPDVDAVWTTWQTAGRGQAGNSWESEQGKNVLMSLRMRHPQVSVSQQFRLTMVVSLAVKKVVAKRLKEHKVTVKWPNDIYVGDKKICGILFEGIILDGKLTETIVGIGLNVNQTEWQNGAPNPVSIKLLTQQDSDLQSIYDDLCNAITEETKDLAHPEQLKEKYLAVLYRFGQKARFVKREVSVIPSRIVTNEVPDAFEATIVDVTEQGELVLDTGNEKQTYHFKQIQFVI